MSDERRRILDLLGCGKISAEEAEQLLDALAGESAQGASQEALATTAAEAKPKARYLRILVDDGEGEKKEHVDIRVPFELLLAGIKLSALIPKKAQDKLSASLSSKGINLNLGDLTGTAEELIESFRNLAINVDEEKTKVRIFCE